MTKREARRLAEVIGTRARERGRRIKMAEVLEEAPEACKVLGADVAFANAVNGWTTEDKRRAARRRAVAPPKNEE